MNLGSLSFLTTFSQGDNMKKLLLTTALSLPVLTSPLLAAQNGSQPSKDPEEQNKPFTLEQAEPRLFPFLLGGGAAVLTTEVVKDAYDEAKRYLRENFGDNKPQR